MKAKKLLSILSVVLIVCMLCSACGNSGTEETHKGTLEVSGENEFPIVKEKTSLKIFTPKPSDVEDIETNLFTQYLEDKTNVHIEWDFAAGDVRQAINIKLASGDFSDIWQGYGCSIAEQASYYEQGAFIDITGLIEKHGYNIKKMFEENPEYEKNLHHMGDVMVGVPLAVNDFSEEAPYKMWVYGPWMEKLNAELPTTTDEFYELLKRFKNEDPNGNGIADEIPLASRNMLGNPNTFDTYMMSAFTPWSPYGLFNDNGKAAFAPITEGAKEGIRWMRKLYAEGLIHPDSFTMDRNRMTALTENDVPILGAAASKWTTQFGLAGSETGRVNEYIAIPPLKGPNGFCFTPGGADSTSGSNGWYCITTDCKEPEVAIKWIDYFYSEEQYLINRGPFGLRVANEGEIGYDGEPAKFAIDEHEGAADITMQNDRWPTSAGAYWSLENSIKTQNNTSDAKRQQNSYDAYLLYKPYMKANVAYTDIRVSSEDADDYNELRTLMQNAWNSGFASFIIGEKDIDKDWDAYVQNFYDLGLERYLEICQKHIDQTK